jgi:hypothetical protein
VIRGGDLNKPQIFLADVSRVWTYGDMSRNLAIQENDIVFVPRERLGDAKEAAVKIFPLVYIGITPIFFAALIPTFFPGAVAK